MVEGSLRSVDPLAYYVNTLSDFNAGVVDAYKKNDQVRIKQLASTGNLMDMDLFICVNKAWHAFVLCVPAGAGPSHFYDFSDVLQSPFDVPAVSLECYQFELGIEDDELGTYMIRKECPQFKNVKGRIQRSYYIGRFKETSVNALEFAALRAAPRRYSVILKDCVEFAKEFCIQALAYCSNWDDLEEQVHGNIKKATASGLSAEKLSRNIRSSGLLGNTFLGGVEIGGLMSSRYGVVRVVAFAVFLLCYPAVVSVIIFKLLK